MLGITLYLLGKHTCVILLFLSVRATQPSSHISVSSSLVMTCVIILTISHHKRWHPCFVLYLYPIVTAPWLDPRHTARQAPKNLGSLTPTTHPMPASSQGTPMYLQCIMIMVRHAWGVMWMCNWILVIHDSEIAESSAYNQLMEKNGMQKVCEKAIIIHYEYIHWHQLRQINPNQTQNYSRTWNQVVFHDSHQNIRHCHHPNNDLQTVHLALPSCCASHLCQWSKACWLNW